MARRKYGRSGLSAPATSAVGTSGRRRRGRTAAGWASVNGTIGPYGTGGVGLRRPVGPTGAAVPSAMSFDVAAEAYDRFMGRFSVPLAPLLADAADVRAGQTALDVGCGPGALTTELVARLGADAVTAVDPSEPFVVAARERLPGVRVLTGVAEDLPLADDSVDRAAAQLVVHFMADPVAGLVEMGRVTRPDGLLAACVWDHGGGRGPLSLFWRAVHDLDPTARGEGGDRPGTSEGGLGDLCRRAGLTVVEETSLTVSSWCSTPEDWWGPFELGVGPAGAYVAHLDEAHRQALRQHCIGVLPTGRFAVEATAWCVTARP